MRKHFADLKIGEQFKIGDKVFEKIAPVFTANDRLRGNFKNAKTDELCRCRGLAMVEIVHESDEKI